MSYGDPGETIDLGPLNVLIGPNASGKSNLIETIGLLRSTPSDLSEPLRLDGVEEWLWKGGKGNPVAEIEATVEFPQGRVPIRYGLKFTAVDKRLSLVDEFVENDRTLGSQYSDVIFYYRFQQGHPALNVRLAAPEQNGNPEFRERRLKRENLDLTRSVLSQLKDADQYPEIGFLQDRFATIRSYREWNLGRYTAARSPQRIDLPADFLAEDAGNLALVLNELQRDSQAQRQILTYLRKLYEEATDFTVIPQVNTVQLFVSEGGVRIPATRLSDGTLRYLCLLSILCHPSPPSLVCIEEPEIGLHPDALAAVAELLQDASQRMQIIVTTHSDVLVSALSDTVESVLVCDRDRAGSHLQRLDSEKLRDWLDKYSLGEIWRMGEIGGNRW